MQFHYLDPQAEIHSFHLKKSMTQSIVDIDVHWLRMGHVSFSGRLHQMMCFEKLVRYIPDDHQFTFRQWYDMRTRETHCIWYGVSKTIMALLPEKGAVAQTVAFTLSSYFPPIFRNKAILVFVGLPECELVAGYVQGHCVCVKKLPANLPINVQHEWNHIQQAYPQWSFECSLYLSASLDVDNELFQTHQETIHFRACADGLRNRVMLYGLN